jgi:transcriptional regulator with XRE-family HTH domain
MVNTNILIERNKKGYKPAYMANKLGIAEKSYRNIELGVTETIQIDRVKKIASILEMEDWNDLLKENEKVNQIVNGDNNTNNNHFYTSKSALIHENEKLQIRLDAQAKENEFLLRQVAYQQEIIELLKAKG